MKDLKSTIYEKLDINKVMLNDKQFVKKFPLNATIEEIVDYLKDHKFKEVPWPTSPNFNKFKKDIEKEHRKVFSRYEDTTVRFANTSGGKEISDKNPIFVIFDAKLPSNQLHF